MPLQRQKNATLHVESLEPRMMLSTVALNATGDTGEELIELKINGETAEVFELSSGIQQFTYETDQPLLPSQIQVHFVNDLYLPEQGVDRNVTVESIEIDGVEFLTNANDVFATGVWDSDAQEIVGGFDLGNSLQANGFFLYGVSRQIEQIEFAGRTWNVVAGAGQNDTLSIDQSGTLTISGGRGPLAISTLVDVEPGTFYNFSTVGFRNIEEGSFSSDSQPWATFGVDFYNDSGVKLGQYQSDINTETEQNIFTELVPPAGTAEAYAWYWIDRFQPGVNIPLQVESFNVEAVQPGDDTVRPNVTLVPATLTGANERIFNFTVDITDNLRIGQIPGDSLTISGPNGFVSDSILATGLPGNTNTFQRLIFFFQAPNGIFTPADNGVYQVALKPNKISDFAGNFADAAILGEIEVAIEIGIG